jgi:hypothetical protein
MNEMSESVLEHSNKTGAMFARFGEGHWYAILPSMAATFRKMGAIVSILPDGTHVEEIQNNFLR